jgi:S1-C subfamily serine protease
MQSQPRFEKLSVARATSPIGIASRRARMTQARVTLVTLFALTAAIVFMNRSHAGTGLVRVQAAAEAPKDAATSPAASSPATAALDAESMLSAIVRVKMRAVPGARSSSTLGPERNGSGVIIDAQGHILTIGYIVNEADSIEVTGADSKTVPALLVAYDHATGIGLLRATLPLKGTPLPIGQSAGLAVREPVMILPAGGRESASVAYVMSRRSFAGGWEYFLDSAIFTAPPTMNWSGAALVNREGKLVGIGSLLVRDTMQPGAPLPGNMFVPIDVVQPILAELIQNGKRNGPQQPWLGMSTEESQGRLFVTRVSPEGPADKAGIRRGDIVLGVGADTVQSLEEFYRKVWAIGPAGAEVSIKVLQGPQLKEIRVRTIDRNQYFREKSST